MIWSVGDGVVRLAVAAGGRPGPGAGSGAGGAAHSVRGTLEQSLPGEWAALVLTFVVIAVVGAAILVATCVWHERVVARRRARRLAVRGGSTRAAAQV